MRRARDRLSDDRICCLLLLAGIALEELRVAQQEGLSFIVSDYFALTSVDQTPRTDCGSQ